MPNEYNIGQEVRLTATFSSAPTAAIITVVKPSGTVLNYLSSGFTSQGNWNASTNSPSLADGTGTAGHYYTANVAGTQTFGDESITFAVNDRIYYNGKVWRKVQNVQSTALTASSSTVFYIDQYLSAAGTWLYGSDGVGVRATSENHFIVRRQRVSG